jgi:hypothetical protein
MTRPDRRTRSAYELQRDDYVHDTATPMRVESVTPDQFGSITVVGIWAAGTEMTIHHPRDLQLDVTRLVDADDPIARQLSLTGVTP